jgi:lambda repressor-like predicted transcriptional regulator
MPEKGWYSLTIRASTAKSVRELAKAKGLTADELLNELMTPTKGDEWIACRLCGVKVKTVNLSSRIAKMHPG